MRKETLEKLPVLQLGKCRKAGSWTRKKLHYIGKESDSVIPCVP